MKIISFIPWGIVLCSFLPFTIQGTEGVRSYQCKAYDCEWHYKSYPLEVSHIPGKPRFPEEHKIRE